MDRIVANDNYRGSPQGLNGVRVLVVEDDPLLLLDLELMLSDAGATIVGLCQSVHEALTHTAETDFSVAVLDFHLGSETVTPVACQLKDRGVPFVLYTAQSRHEDGVAKWRDIAAIVPKPSPPEVLLTALRAAVAR